MAQGQQKQEQERQKPAPACAELWVQVHSAHSYLPDGGCAGILACWPHNTLFQPLRAPAANRASCTRHLSMPPLKRRSSCQNLNFPLLRAVKAPPPAASCCASHVERGVVKVLAAHPKTVQLVETHLHPAGCQLC